MLALHRVVFQRPSTKYVSSQFPIFDKKTYTQINGKHDQENCLPRRKLSATSCFSTGTFVVCVLFAAILPRSAGTTSSTVESRRASVNIIFSHPRVGLPASAKLLVEFFGPG